MLPFVRIWLWISALATLAGWALSICGQLNRTGYGIFFIAAAIVTVLLRKNFLCGQKKIPLHKKFSRFRRPLPFCFAALTILILISGVIHAPANYTGLTYRCGRVLQWLAHGSWFWIHTSVYRMNDRACGIEWLSAPILLFTNSLRPLFLLNFIPFLLMPGLIFSVFTRLGVNPRVARQWMWLLPTGYIFLLQAAGIANDAFPTVYALAAIDFALRAKKSSRVSDFYFSILAAALLTGAKASNLPLLLPWAILIFPQIHLLRKNAAATAITILLAAVVSFLPTAILNFHFCGDWSGAALEPENMTEKNPFAGIVGNTLQFLLQNFCPPIFPFAGWWNQHAPQFLPQALASISNHFDTGFFQLGELPTEDSAGIGFGLSLLLAISIYANFSVRKIFSIQSSHSTTHKLILILPWLALLAYSTKSGMTTASRLIAPYYPLLLPLILIGDLQRELIRSRLWKIWVVINFVFAFAILILTPDRPLWPAQTVLSRLAAQHPYSHLLSRAQKVYSVYAHRADPLADVRKLLPENVKTVGFIGGADDCDISLWLPLGSGRVEHFLYEDPPEKIRGQKIEFVIIGGYNLKTQNQTIDGWLQKSGAQLFASTTATLKVSEGPQPWFVAKLK